ncbi:MULTISPECIES: tripartite tricarboxylate transporter substrate binding protein [unclassified Achromobacter]|uniref:tripartite tricarboxylate transporter substrate binding protein n=1 Tax=unclassified Achromobacter TaxID=2626865 RepID=UPI000B5191ED|nr:MULTISPECIES: tripartite tricarboxylate transporter substrate binding protein [unclassified Achromobacter]OWT80192.1 LacI family transcriptional regulator [Achromobacter sp. HZ34]OWT82075.1 LacI family transcriptional regulator [Achromobacter sp. HZ28]
MNRSVRATLASRVACVTPIAGIARCIANCIAHYARHARAALITAGTLGLTLTATAATAAGYPNNPIRIIVPFAAGGTSDLVTRILAQAMGTELKVAVIVDNRPGAGGNIGSELVARAAPDGYTLLMGTVATHGINASLYKSMPFDPVKDFAPVSLVASTPSVLEVNPALPVKSVAELIAYAKAHPGKLYFGSAGNGSSHHLAGELFDSMAGVKMTHVPYRGTAAAVTDTMGGQVQVIFDTLPSAMPFVKSGQLRALAVTSAQRDPALPDLPTLAEAGLPGYEVGSWYGLLAPAGTPPEIVDKVSKLVAELVRRPDIKQKLQAQGATAVGSTPAEFATHIAGEIKKWRPVVQESGARVD